MQAYLRFAGMAARMLAVPWLAKLASQSDWADAHDSSGRALMVILAGSSAVH